jgi:hypothetical protein
LGAGRCWGAACCARPRRRRPTETDWPRA